MAAEKGANSTPQEDRLRWVLSVMRKKYYGARPGSALQTNLVWMLTDAVDVLIHMLEGHENIGIDWGIDGGAYLGQRKIDCPVPQSQTWRGIPDPILGELSPQTLENAFRNYREFPFTMQDIEGLARYLPESDHVRELMVIVYRISSELVGRPVAWDNKHADSDEEEIRAIENLREIVRRACEMYAERLKQLVAEFAVDVRRDAGPAGGSAGTGQPGKSTLGTKEREQGSDQERHVEAKRTDSIRLPEYSTGQTTSKWAEIFQCSPSTILRRIKKEELTAKRDGRKWRLRLDQLPAEYVQKAIQK